MGRPKPPISAWIVSGRKAKAWKPADLAAALRERGVRCEEGTVRTWEAGRKPADDAIAEMERLFGVQAPREEPAAASADVLRAIERQTEMLERQWAATTALVGHLGDLVAEMRADRQEARGRGDAFVDILAELRSAVGQPNTASEDAEPPRTEDPAPRRRERAANGGGQ